MTEDIDLNGQRFVPTIGGNIFLEHMHRYHLAQNLVKDKDVLDIASGKGIGSALLAQTARSVVGVDSSRDAVIRAKNKYKIENLSFEVGRYNSIPLPSDSIDTIISFQALEYVGYFDVFFSEIKRVLRNDGTLIISIPECPHHEATGSVNTPHVKKILKADFEKLLHTHFSHVTIHGQKIGFGSIIVAENAPGPFFETDAANHTTTAGIANPSSMIAVASDIPMRAASIGGIFSQDIRESEPFLKSLEFERAQWADTLIKDIDQIADEMALLRRENRMAHSSLGTLITHLIYVQFLYVLSKIGLFSSRRRKRLLRSAEKRDPVLFLRILDQFFTNFSKRISTNEVISACRANIISRDGLKVTAIVPNFNHAQYLPQRLESILSQTYDLIDIIILDDCSTDDSRLVINAYVEHYPKRIRAIYNSENSGSVFHQWQKGHSHATGDLVWICESDDFCEPTFVERVIGAFKDPSVMLAFGRIQFANSEGELMAGLDRYREESEAGIWDTPTVRPAATWFRAGFGVRNVIANVGGSLWRRFDIPDQVWEEARNFRIMGDWYLYSAIAGGGQIAYEPSATSYFRIHQSNTSGHSAQSKPEYCKEYFRLMAALKARWEIPDETLVRFLNSCRSVFLAAGGSSSVFDEILDASALRALPKSDVHVLVGILGFSFGGGEIFPIHLANALRRQGIMVSILQMSDIDYHRDVRLMLDSGIPIYTAKAVREAGIAKFLKAAGISIVHSHIANVESFLLDKEDVSIPYIVTLHGSYEAMNIDSGRISRWSQRIDKITYTADRNLAPFKSLQIPQDRFLKMRNAMPIDHISFPKSRQNLDIDDDAVVFSLVARGTEGKGWVEAVRAYLLLRQRRPDVQVALLMVGEGPSTEAAKHMAASDPTIHFLGFVKEIYGLYRISDVALLPTRFPGESFPLCLIQALQVGVPCVATDIGEIRNMTQIEGRHAGIIISNNSDDDLFVRELTAAMELILDKAVRVDLATNARVLGGEYDIDDLARKYIEEYSSIVDRRTTA